MALLQACRAYTLGLPLESAYSWGLNRAIFIAAAKRGFKGGKRAPQHDSKTNLEKKDNEYYLGDDMAYKEQGNDVLRFTIGGEVQTKQDFERQVEARFGDEFPRAWKEGLAYVKKFDRETLLSGNEFFNVVYRPKRDEWARKWTEEAKRS